MTQPIVIIGCGPAGLFAAHTVEMVGLQPLIISRKGKSDLTGAQYLHRPIPDLSSAAPDGYVLTSLIGNKEAYTERVYGSREIGTSWDHLPVEPTPCWDIRKAYDEVWDRFEPLIVDQEVTGEDVDDLTANFETVISTIPQWQICDAGHDFKSVPILIKHETIMVIHEDEDPGNFVVYNGTGHGSWYRTSRIFGKASTEAIAKPPPEVQQGWDAVGYKIVGTNCDCHPNVIRTGRHGLWKRGVLTHHVVEHTIEAIHARV